MEGAEATLLGTTTEESEALPPGGGLIIDGVNEEKALVWPLERLLGRDPCNDDTVDSPGVDAIDGKDGTLLSEAPLGSVLIGVGPTLEGVGARETAELTAGDPTTIVVDVLVRIVVGPFGIVLVNVTKEVDVEDTEGVFDTGTDISETVVGVVRVRTVVRPLEATLVIVIRTLDMTGLVGLAGESGAVVAGMLGLDNPNAVLPLARLLTPGVPMDGVRLGTEPGEPGNDGSVVPVRLPV